MRGFGTCRPRHSYSPRAAVEDTHRTGPVMFLTKGARGLFVGRLVQNEQHHTQDETRLWPSSLR